MNRKVAVRMTISEIRNFCRLAMAKNMNTWKRGYQLEVVGQASLLNDQETFYAGGLEFCNLKLK